ncbi:MAG: DMP19 family protein [Prevotella sp.]|nr:DMP19 family protein [Prevotella sp.]
MMTVSIQDEELRKAAEEGFDAFLNLVIDKTRNAMGGELTAENMAQMSSNQITLMGYAMLRDELMDGGFIQLIHNGYGPFFFRNPFDAAMRNWGVVELCRLMRRAKKQYLRYREEIEKEMDDDEFMALYEKIPAFEDLDDEFVSNEEKWSEQVAVYVDEHLTELVEIKN